MATKTKSAESIRQVVLTCPHCGSRHNMAWYPHEPRRMQCVECREMVTARQIERVVEAWQKAIAFLRQSLLSCCQGGLQHRFFLTRSAVGSGQGGIIPHARGKQDEQRGNGTGPADV